MLDAIIFCIISDLWWRWSLEWAVPCFFWKLHATLVVRGWIGAIDNLGLIFPILFGRELNCLQFDVYDFPTTTATTAALLWTWLVYDKRVSLTPTKAGRTCTNTQKHKYTNTKALIFFNILILHFLPFNFYFAKKEIVCAFSGALIPFMSIKTDLSLVLIGFGCFLLFSIFGAFDRKVCAPQVL